MTREEQHAAFVKLIETKFGTKRGYMARASLALQINQGNLSQMLKGALTIPQKHLDKLLELEDYAENDGVKEFMENGVFTVRLSSIISTKAQRALELIQRVHSPAVNYAQIDLLPPQMTELLDHVTAAAVKYYEAEYPDLVKHVRKIIDADLKAAAQRIRDKANANRHVVEDELDPLA